MQKTEDHYLYRAQARPRPVVRTNKLILATSLTLLIAILMACSPAGNSPDLSDGPTLGDVTALEWFGTAIGYADEQQRLEVSSASVEDGIVVVGSGADIWGTQDEFYFTYTTLTGDGTLSLQVDELSAADPWSKAGIMIREDLEVDARNALLHISGGNGSVFQARLSSGSGTVNHAGSDPSATVGNWLRLTRTGDLLTGELSYDGTNWIQVGSYELPMQDEVLIGMAVTAHARGAKATAKFKHLRYRSGADQGRAPNDPGQPAPPAEPKLPAPGAPGSAFQLPPATLYVSPSGNDSNSGRSASSPLRTVRRAASMVRPGDVVYLRGGVYPIEVNFTASGTASQPIVWASYPGEWAIFDGSGLAKGSASDRMWVDGADFNVFANFEVRNGPRQGIYVINGANDNLFTGLVVHSNNGSGIQNANSHRNRYEYLTVHDNFDEVNIKGQVGQDADGIGISSGDRNVISHVLSYRNSDDGIDAWKSTNTLIEYSVSHSNGRGSHGNGNGFKAGGGVDNYTIVRHSVAFNNKAVGFTSNSGRHITFVNNTAFNNGQYAFLGHNTITFRNNIAAGGVAMVTSSTQERNSWNLGISDPRFVSTDPASAGFLALRSDSPAIDAGVSAGYEYSGSAPDLGALEHGARIASLVGPSSAVSSGGGPDLAGIGALGY